MKKLIISTLTVAILWFVMFSPWTAPHLNFWAAMSVSGIALMAISFFIGGTRIETKELTFINILIGVVTAAALWGVFWLGNFLSTRWFGFAQGQINSIYDMKNGNNPLIVGALLLLVIGPAEEFFWRGYFQRSIDEICSMYVTANTFQNQYMNAACSAKSGHDGNKVADFLRFYQLIDLLIIDDVHDFADKKGTQGAFFHIFNYLHQSGKQLVLTSDKPPVELQGLEQRLLSRFKWGLSAELLPPSYETRLAILKAKCSREGVEVSDEVLSYIAHNVKNNIRELEGILFSLIANATFAQKNISLALARDIVEKIVTEPKIEITIPKIQNTVCQYFGISEDMFMSKTRKREIVQARQIAMYLSRNMTKTSLASIGEALGGKDHATVLHACNTVNDLIDTDRNFRSYLHDIEKMLNNAE